MKLLHVVVAALNAKLTPASGSIAARPHLPIKAPPHSTSQVLCETVEHLTSLAGRSAPPLIIRLVQI